MDFFRSLYSKLPHDVRRDIYARLNRRSYARLQRMRSVSLRGYSYEQFDATESIFVHIPKAAGVSVCRALYGNLAAGHVSMRVYQRVFSRKDFEEYFKFSFVRNPWDRLFSAYSFLRQGGMNQKDREWASKHLVRFENFEDFVMSWVTPSNIRRYIHFLPQTELLAGEDSSRLPLDFVGFYENIGDDFRYVASRVNKGAFLEHDNRTTTSHRSYADFYSEKMVSRVAEVYKRDIETLGYSFDNSSLEKQLLLRNRNLTS